LMSRLNHWWFGTQNLGRAVSPRTPALNTQNRPPVGLIILDEPIEPLVV